MFQNSFAVQIYNFHRKFAAQMKFFRRETTEFCEMTIWRQGCSAFFALICPRNSFFYFVDDYDALLCPKYANCRGSLNKSVAAA